jgi:hypothetical protein
MTKARKLAPEILRRIAKSRKFLQWTPIHYKRSSTRFEDSAASEKHFSPNELAEQWGFSVDTIRDIFRNEPGVLKHKNNGAKRSYTTLRIPERIAIRVHSRLAS